MKKRVLSAFMALVLCLTLLPAPALAAETAETNVAEVTIGSTTKQYADIVAAFTAAQEAASATVKLLKNVTILKNADGYSYGIRLKSGDITLDLNGHTIQTTGGASGFVPLYAVFYIENGSSLTVQDNSANSGGKIVQPNGGQAINVGGALTVESGIIEVTSDSADADNATTTQNCAVFVRGSGVDESLLFTILVKLGVPKAQLERELSGLSTGQKKKVLIARSLCEQAHLHVWDEPMNYIDVIARIQIEQMLLEFRPTLIFAEHDRAFCERIATQTVMMEAL